MCSQDSSEFPIALLNWMPSDRHPLIGKLHVPLSPTLEKIKLLILNSTGAT